MSTTQESNNTELCNSDVMKLLQKVSLDNVGKAYTEKLKKDYKLLSDAEFAELYEGYEKCQKCGMETKQCSCSNTTKLPYHEIPTCEGCTFDQPACICELSWLRYQ